MMTAVLCRVHIFDTIVCLGTVHHIIFNQRPTKVILRLYNELSACFSSPNWAKFTEHAHYWWDFKFTLGNKIPEGVFLFFVRQQENVSVCGGGGG